MWNLIKQTCKEKNITINQLCENLGVTYQSLFITINKRDMRVSTLKRIADALGVAPSVLLDYDKDTTPDNTAPAPCSDNSDLVCPYCGGAIQIKIISPDAHTTANNE